MAANIQHQIGQPCTFTARAPLMGLALHDIECATAGQDTHLTRKAETLEPSMLTALVTPRV